MLPLSLLVCLCLRRTAPPPRVQARGQGPPSNPFAGQRNPFKLAGAKQGTLLRSFQGDHWEPNSGMRHGVLSESADCAPETSRASLYMLETPPPL